MHTYKLLILSKLEDLRSFITIANICNIIFNWQKDIKFNFSVIPYNSISKYVIPMTISPTFSR